MYRQYHYKRIAQWFHSHLHCITFTVLSIFSFGVIIPIPLLNSNLFGCSLFSMQMSTVDINHVPILKVPNLFTQMLPFAFGRIIYLWWTLQYDIIVLSSFIPVILSFIITAYHLLHDRNAPAAKQLECTFEVAGLGPDSMKFLDNLRGLGLTKHFGLRLHEIYQIEPDQIEVYKPLDLVGAFEMAFTVRAHRGTLVRVENEFIKSVQNEHLSRVKMIQNEIP